LDYREQPPKCQENNALAFQKTKGKNRYVTFKVDVGISAEKLASRRVSHAKVHNTKRCCLNLRGCGNMLMKLDKRNNILYCLELSNVAGILFSSVESSPDGTYVVSGVRNPGTGQGIGGIRETQEMLDFCGEQKIVCDIEKIRIQQINEAYDRMLKSDVKYRSVIDMASLRTEST